MTTLPDLRALEKRMGQSRGCPADRVHRSTITKELNAILAAKGIVTTGAGKRPPRVAASAAPRKCPASSARSRKTAQNNGAPINQRLAQDARTGLRQLRTHVPAYLGGQDTAAASGAACAIAARIHKRRRSPGAACSAAAWTSLSTRHRRCAASATGATSGRPEGAIMTHVDRLNIQAASSRTKARPPSKASDASLLPIAHSDHTDNGGVRRPRSDRSQLRSHLLRQAFHRERAYDTPGLAASTSRLRLLYPHSRLSKAETPTLHNPTPSQGCRK